MGKFGIFLIILSVLILIGAGVYIVNPLKDLSEKRDQQRVHDLTNVSRALERYYRDNGHYPHFNAEYMIVTGEETHPWGFSWLPYINPLPKDPSGSKRYVYWADEGNNYQSYGLYTSLDLPEEMEGSCKSGAECPGVPGANLCGGKSNIFIPSNKQCNFGITSSNISP